MAGSRANWEAAIMDELKQNTRAKNVNSGEPKPVSTPSAAQQQAERAGKSLGGLGGGAANALIERKKRQQEMLDSLDY